MRLTTPSHATQQSAPTELRSLHADKTTRTVQFSREHRQICDHYTRTKQPELCNSAESTDKVAISTRGQKNPNCATQQRAPTELRSLHADKTTRTVQFSREHRQRCDLYNSMVLAPPSKKDNTYKRTTLHGTSKRPPTKFVSSLRRETEPWCAPTCMKLKSRSFQIQFGLSS